MESKLQFLNRSRELGFWVKRVLRNNTRLLLWECGHIELWPASIPLPAAPRTGVYVKLTPARKREIRINAGLATGVCIGDFNCYPFH